MRFYEILAILICLPDDSRQTRYSDHGPPRTLPTPSSLRLQDCRITLSMFEPVLLGPPFPRSGARYNIDCHLEKPLTWLFLLKPEYPERFDITATVTGVGGVPAPFGLNSDFRDCRMGLSRFGSWWSWSFAHPFLGHEMRHNIDCHIDEDSVEQTWVPFLRQHPDPLNITVEFGSDTNIQHFRQGMFNSRSPKLIKSS